MIPSILAAAIVAVPAVALAQVTPATYVAKAGAGDQYEIQSSRLVGASTTNPAIKQFAGMMVTDHEKSTAMVKAAAMQAKPRPAPPKLDPMQARDIAKLRAASGTERDRLYVEQQKMAHQQALALHRSYAATGSSPYLKSAAAKIVPVVQTHISELSRM